MHLRSVFLLGLACWLASCATAASPQADRELLPPEAVEQYMELARQLKNSAPGIDFAKLRLYSTALAGFDPFSKNKELLELESLVREEKFTLAEKTINDLFISCCADPDFHEQAIMLYLRLGNMENVRFHESIREGLIASIIETRKGSGFTDAFVIVHYRETAAVLEALQLRATDFSHEEKNGHHWDIVETEDAGGGRQTLYFNVDRIYAWLVDFFTSGL